MKVQNSGFVLFYFRKHESKVLIIYSISEEIYCFAISSQIMFYVNCLLTFWGELLWKTTRLINIQRYFCYIRLHSRNKVIISDSLFSSSSISAAFLNSAHYWKAIWVALSSNNKLHCKKQIPIHFHAFLHVCLFQLFRNSDQGFLLILPLICCTDLLVSKDLIIV